MAFVVIAVHTQPLINCENEKIIILYKILEQLAVPFYFLASGYLLAVKMKYPYGKSSLNQIEIQFKKILKMYLIWTIIYSPMAIYHFIDTKTSFVKAVLVYIRGFFLIGEQYNSWQLWYLLSVIYTLAGLMIVLHFNKTSKTLLTVSILFSAISVLFSELAAYEESLPLGLMLLQKLIKYSILTGRIFLGMVYIPIGMLLAHKSIPKIWNYIGFFVCLICNYYIDNSIVSNYLLIFTAITLFGIVKSIQLNDSKIYIVFRRMSMVIYLIHMYVWSIYYTIIYGEKTFGIDAFLVTSVISALIAVIYLKFRQNVIMH